MYWMKDMVEKVGRAKDLVIDPCGGTFATSKASMLLAQHGRFVGFDVDSSCFKQVLF